MLKVENIDTYGWEAAIRGMRNPLNSWDKSDSCFWSTLCSDIDITDGFCIGDNDLALMKKLSKSGSDHGKFLRMIHISMDITAPLYWWKEFDTYKVGTTANSCSTMHKVAEKEFTFKDFSHEHLISGDQLSDDYDNWMLSDSEGYVYTAPEGLLSDVIEMLNVYRNIYIHWDSILSQNRIPEGITKKDIWWQMIQLLPSSYNQKRTVDLNYQVVKNIYFARINHKLDEWHTLCTAFENLPYFKELILCED